MPDANGAVRVDVDPLPTASVAVVEVPLPSAIVVVVRLYDAVVDDSVLLTAAL